MLPIQVPFNLFSILTSPFQLCEISVFDIFRLKFFTELGI